MKKLFTLFLALAANISLFAEGIAVNGIWYNFDQINNTATVTYRGDYYYSFEEYTGSVVIPEKVIYQEVEYAVTTIGESAFTGCSRLTSVTIPSSVTMIDNGAFHTCSNLSSVTMGEGIEIIGSNAFKACSSLRTITIPNSVLTIGENAFYECRLAKVALGNSVTGIGQAAFAGCIPLDFLEIPASVTSIGDWAFQGCDSLTTVTCYATTPPTIQYGTFDIGYWGSGKETLYVPKGLVGVYSEAEHWKRFPYILEIGGSQGVDQTITNHSKNSHKVIRNDQVLIQSGDHIFTISGADVK